MKNKLLQNKTVRDQGGLILVIIVLCVIFTLLNPTFMTGDNIMNIVRQAAVNIILAMGITMVMIAGELDLSLGGVACVTGMVIAKLLTSGLSIPLVILLGLLLGAGIGLLSGWLSTAFSLSSLIITLAIDNASKGTANLITGGTAVYGLPEEFETLGRGMIGAIPVQVFIMVVIVVASWIILNKTLLGRYAMAIGGNNQVAKLAGIPVKKYKRIYFIICSALAALAGMILTSRLASGQPTLATNVTMDSITASVLGGTAMAGGYGSVVGSTLGALLLTIITNGLTINGINSYWQMVISAAILIVTIVARRKKD